MRYRYTGVNRHRVEVSGTIEAEDEIQARARVRSLQVRVTELEAAGDEGASKEIKRLLNVQLVSPISLRQLIVFTRQFSSMIDSGIPIVQCLDVLQAQEKPKSQLKKILLQVKEDIESGAGLAVALQKHQNIFGELFIRVVESGEVSGTLDVSFKQMGTQFEKTAKLRAKVIGAVTYPAMTLLVALGVLTFLLVKVVPEITKLYSESSAKLPTATLMVIGLSDWVTHNFQFIIGGITFAGIASIVLYNIESFRLVFDPLILKIPLFGPLILKAAVAQITRTMSTLVHAGVPLLTVFDVVLKVVSNRAINQSLKTATEYVSEGKTMAQGLAAQNIFPLMFIQMVNVGEMTGRLDDLLKRLADIYEEEVDTAVEVMTSTLQPAIIVIVGVMIALLMISMYLPIFQLAEKISGV